MPRPALPKFLPVLRALTVLAACLFAMSAVQFAHAGPDAPAAPGSIAGIVRNEVAAPLAGINVEVYWPNGQIARTTTTDANGRWRATLLPASITPM